MFTGNVLEFYVCSSHARDLCRRQRGKNGTFFSRLSATNGLSGLLLFWRANLPKQTGPAGAAVILANPLPKIRQIVSSSYLLLT